MSKVFFPRCFIAGLCAVSSMNFAWGQTPAPAPTTFQIERLLIRWKRFHPPP